MPDVVTDGARSTWQPTNAVPMQGLDGRAAPDAGLPVAARLDPLLEVRVVARLGDWAQIVCSNGWMAWVDGRRLLSVEEGAAQLRQAWAVHGGQPTTGAG